MLFVKNRGKQTVEHLEGSQNANDNDVITSESKKTFDNLNETHSKEFDRQSTITRLVVLNTATEILKTHRKSIEITSVVSIASQLKQWALSK